MAKFTVSVEWVMHKYVEVDAETLTEAVNIVAGQPECPEGGEYLDRSFRVNEEITSEINNE
jgi:hypothetical protein